LHDVHTAFYKNQSTDMQTVSPSVLWRSNSVPLKYLKPLLCRAETQYTKWAYVSRDTVLNKIN